LIDQIEDIRDIESTEGKQKLERFTEMLRKVSVGGDSEHNEGQIKLNLPWEGISSAQIAD
jgi:hypothetical protein